MPTANTDIRPDPDPTIATHSLVDVAVHAVKEILETRLTGYDKAIQLLQAQQDKQPSVGMVAASVLSLEKQIGTQLDGMEDVNALLKEFNEEIRNHLRVETAGLKELMNERFKGVDEKFAGRDTALTAALQAQKESAGAQQIANAEAIQKSELATTKQIDGMGDKIEDIKERFTSSEGNKQGGASTFSTGIAIAGIVIALIASVAAVAAIFIHLKS